MADLNHDDRTDIIVGYTSSSSVSAWLGNGDGTFASRVDLDSGGLQARVIAVSDLNLDQNLDLLVGHGTVGFSVLLGNGDGTFEPAMNTGGASEVLDAAIGLLDADVYPDVALGHAIPHGFSIFLGDGDGTFATPTFYPSPGESPTPAIALTDMNQDLELDLLLGWGGVLFYSGNGDGTFDVPATWLQGPSAEQIEVGDLNQDTVPDIATAGGIRNKVSIWLGTGAGSFGPRTDHAIPITYSVSLGDLDGDCNLDLAATNMGTLSVSVLCGKGDGTFLPPVDFRTARNPISVAVGDLDGNEMPDLVVACNVSDSVSVLLNATPVDVRFPRDAAALEARHYPDPFRDDLEIEFRMPEAGLARLRVFDATGRLRGTLLNAPRTAGRHAVRWDRRTVDGAWAPAGVYFYELRTSGGRVSKRVTLVR